LIESGGLPPGESMTTLTRLNFVAILTVLEDLVRNDLADHQPELYEALPRNTSDAWSDIVVRGGYLLQPQISTPYRADLAINLSQDDRHDAGCAPAFASRSEIVELGDARFIGAGREVDATDAVIVAPFGVAVEGWRARRWLGEAAVRTLAGLGVASVRWHIAPRHGERAERLAKTLNAAGGARVETVVDAPATKRMSLSRLPESADSKLLGDVVDALTGGGPKARKGGATSLDRTSRGEALAALWAHAEEDGASRPFIRRRRPASFLIVGPASEGRIDFETARLSRVWIDGREVSADR
jgi:hypothetical protein